MKDRVTLHRKLTILAGTVALAGCGLVLGLESPEFDDPLVEAGAPDVVDATTDAKDLDAGADGADGMSAPARFDDSTRWSFWADAGGSAGFTTGPFDGRYLYFIRGRDPDGPDGGTNQPAGRVLRLDTSADFTLDSAWTAFDPEHLVPTIGSTLTASMDGTYLVIGALSTSHFLRFNTANAANFTSPAAWEVFDATGLAPSTNNFGAAANVNGQTYYLPLSNPARPILARPDNASLDAGWQVRPGNADAGALVCPTARTATCAGPFVFFGPSAAPFSGDCFIRLDPSKPITDDSAWAPFRLSTLAPTYGEVLGVIGTPEHVYLTRQTNVASPSGPFEIFRKSATGGMDAGWEIQTSTVRESAATGNLGGVYDGRFIYLAPGPTNSVRTVYSRYDTTKPFASAESWDSVIGDTVGLPPTYHMGASFDGQYVYFAPWSIVAPNKNAGVIRFRAYDAKIAVPKRCSFQ